MPALRGSDQQGQCPTATPRDSRGPTSVVDVPEGRVDELARVTRALRDIQEHGDGVVAAIAQIQQGLWKAGLPGGRLWGERERGRGVLGPGPELLGSGGQGPGRGQGS